MRLFAIILIACTIAYFYSLSKRIVVTQAANPELITLNIDKTKRKPVPYTPECTVLWTNAKGQTGYYC